MIHLLVYQRAPHDWIQCHLYTSICTITDLWRNLSWENSTLGCTLFVFSTSTAGGFIKLLDNRLRTLIGRRRYRRCSFIYSIMNNIKCILFFSAVSTKAGFQIKFRTFLNVHQNKNIGEFLLLLLSQTKRKTSWLVIFWDSTVGWSALKRPAGFSHSFRAIFPFLLPLPELTAFWLDDIVSFFDLFRLTKTVEDIVDFLTPEDRLTGSETELEVCASLGHY